MSDQFMAKLTVANPYPDSRVFEVVAYDEARREIKIWTATPTFSLTAGKSRQVIVTAPFEGQAKRDILLCVETKIDQADGGRLRAQVCSKVAGQRYSPSP